MQSDAKQCNAMQSNAEQFKATQSNAKRCKGRTVLKKLFICSSKQAICARVREVYGSIRTEGMENAAAAAAAVVAAAAGAKSKPMAL